MAVRAGRRAPTHRRRLLVPAVFVVALGCELSRSTRRGSTPRVLTGPLRRPSTCRCIGHVEARRGSCAVRYLSGGVPLPTMRVTWRWSGPCKRREAFLGFRPVIAVEPSKEVRPVCVTRVTVSLSTPLPDGARGVSDAPFAGLIPSDGRAARLRRLGPTCRLSIGRSRCFSRAIGRPVEAGERCVSTSPGFERRASTAAKWGSDATRVERALEGSVDRGSVGSASGFRVLPSAVGPRRRSSFPARARPALGFRLSQV